MRTSVCRSSTVVVLLLALASGCTGDSDPGPITSASPSATSSTSPSPTATESLTPAEQDLAGAEDAVTRFWTVVDDVASSPNKDQNILATVARAQALAQWQGLVADYRSKGWVQKGQSTLAGVEATEEGAKSFVVQACRDVSGVDLVDGQGDSVVLDSRPDKQQFTYVVEKAPEGFFVIQDTLEATQC